VNPKTNVKTDVTNGGVDAADLRTRGLLSFDSEVGRSFAELAENLGALGRPTGSVVVTGPERGVGSTTVCLGLGTALAAAGKKVAIVDCNLDRPYLHRYFDRPNFAGLTSALKGGRDLENYGFDAAPNLRIIPTGPVLPGSWAFAHSPELVGTVRVLEGSRDVVLLDAPVAGELLTAPDLWGSFDGVLLVVHATRTPKGVARGFTDALLGARVDLFGVVLNGYV
jgi:protein-tyrosine kinase